jgi:hypothetical protein
MVCTGGLTAYSGESKMFPADYLERPDLASDQIRSTFAINAESMHFTPSTSLCTSAKLALDQIVYLIASRLTLLIICLSDGTDFRGSEHNGLLRME